MNGLEILVYIYEGILKVFLTPLGLVLPVGILLCSQSLLCTEGLDLDVIFVDCVNHGAQITSGSVI